MRWVAVVVCFAGGLLRIIPLGVFKNRVSGLVAIQPGHRLETGHDLCRDPQPELSGVLDTSLRWVLTFRSGVGVLLVITLLVPLVARIVVFPWCVLRFANLAASYKGLFEFMETISNRG